MATSAPWNQPSMVAGFAAAAPNAGLMLYAGRQLGHRLRPRLLDVGCGAGRNALPLAQRGWRVTGIDQSHAMLAAAQVRREDEPLQLLLAEMDALPIADRSADMIVAHGIWNLAQSGREFRQAVAEAARVAAAHAALFVFTFSRTTLPPSVRPVPGETFVFTDFSGLPQCFLTRSQLLDELGAAGFRPDPDYPLRELNVPGPQCLHTNGPVIFEGGFLRIGLPS